MMLFINPRWDLGRIIYTGLFAFLMYAETVNEEKYFFVKFDSYKKYMQVVPYRFLNYSLIWNKKKINIKTEEKDESAAKETPPKHKKSTLCSCRGCKSSIELYLYYAARALRANHQLSFIFPADVALYDIIIVRKDPYTLIVCNCGENVNKKV